MVESRDALKEEYKEVILLPDYKEKEFRAHCIQFLEKYEVKSCFKLLPLNDIGNEFLEKAAETEDTKYHHLCKIFQQFEKYAARLVVKPWCKDLYTIKVYTGFFKYNFERWMSTDTVYRVFELIGYKTTSAGTLTLDPPHDEKRVLALGLELYLARTQLCRLKTTTYLSSKYLMKDVMEGWMNTTGNPANIVKWLAKNNLEKKETCEVIYRSSTDAQSTTRSEFVITNGKVSHFDKNGHSVKRQSKYPSKFHVGECIDFRDQQDENSASVNSLSSMVIIDYPDSELYGGGDHGASNPQNLKNLSDCSKAKPSFSMPYVSANVNYGNLNGKDGVQSVYNRGESDASLYLSRYNPHNQWTTKDVLDSNSDKSVVSPSANLERDDSHIYGNLTMDSSTHRNIVSSEIGDTVHEDAEDNDRQFLSRVHGHETDKNVLIKGKRYVELLGQRIKNAEKCSEKQNPSLNENFTYCKHSNPISTPDDLQQDVGEGSVTFGNASQRKTTEERPLSQERFSRTNALSDVMKSSSDSCIFCGESPAFCCRRCQEVACERCYESFFKKRPCYENEHECYRISNV